MRQDRGIDDDDDDDDDHDHDIQVTEQSQSLVHSPPPPPYYHSPTLISIRYYNVSRHEGETGGVLFSGGATNSPQPDLAHMCM